MTKVSQSCHTTSMILACCSLFITRFYSTASPHFPKVHHALLQLGILYKKQTEPAKWASVPLLEDVQVAPAPPSPPERPARKRRPGLQPSQGPNGTQVMSQTQEDNTIDQDSDFQS